MTPLPLKYTRILRGEVAPTTQAVADANEAADAARWALRAGRCIMPKRHGALCLNHRREGALLCDDCRRTDG